MHEAGPSAATPASGPAEPRLPDEAAMRVPGEPAPPGAAARLAYFVSV